jgi:hypothetical protein
MLLGTCCSSMGVQGNTFVLLFIIAQFREVLMVINCKQSEIIFSRHVGQFPPAAYLPQPI